MSGTTRPLAAAVPGSGDRLLVFGEGGERDVALSSRRATP
jgi:hypothetical protein